MTTTAALVPGGVDPQRPTCLHLTTTDGNIVLESNYFPVTGDWFSFSIFVSVAAAGSEVPVSLGLVGFDASYTTATYYCTDSSVESRLMTKMIAAGALTFSTDAPHGYRVGQFVQIDIGDGAIDGSHQITGITSQTSFKFATGLPNVAETPIVGRATATQRNWIPTGGSATAGYAQIRGVVAAPEQTREMCLRLELHNATGCWVDNGLVDPHEGQFGYFDGASIDSFPDDYRWMGGEANQHFSLWYNNYQNTHMRLFSDWDQNEQIYKQGLVAEWAPTGSTVIDHWDAVTSFTPHNWSGDAYYPVHEVYGSATSVITDRLSLDGQPVLDLY